MFRRPVCGLQNMRIQAFLTAAAINRKRLRAAIAGLLLRSMLLVRRKRAAAVERPVIQAGELPSALARITHPHPVIEIFNSPTRQRCRIASNTV